MESRQYNTTVLAYMGDAVYEVRIRRMLIGRGRTGTDKLHREAVRYVSAEGQAKAVRSMIQGFLTDEEVKLVKRARNHRVTSHPRYVDPKEYKLATGFEALVGFLYLEDQSERLEEILSEAVRVIEEA